MAAVGVAPAGNVSGMGPVVAPNTGHEGSGDAWPSLGAVATCPICGKTKKRCKCKKKKNDDK